MLMSLNFKFLSNYYCLYKISTWPLEDIMDERQGFFHKTSSPYVRSNKEYFAHPKHTEYSPL